MKPTRACWRRIAVILSLALSAATATSASAGFYSSTSSGIFQGTPPISDPRSGTDPVSTGFFLARLGGNRITTIAAADRGQVRAIGDVRSDAPESAKTTATGELVATARDVVIRKRDGTDFGLPVSASLILTPVYSANFSGAAATSTSALFNNGDMRWSAAALGQSVGGSGRVTPLGVSGDLNTAKELVFSAIIGEIFEVTISMFAGVSATARMVDPISGDILPATASFSAELSVGDVFATGSRLSADSFAPRRAFNLPEGFTADSAELNIVDNQWLGPTLSIPEPTFSLIALLATALVSRRTCCPFRRHSEQR